MTRRIQLLTVGSRMTVRAFDRQALVDSVLATARAYGTSSAGRHALAAKLLLDVIVAVEPLATSGTERRELALELMRSIASKLAAQAEMSEADQQLLDLWREALRQFEDGMDRVLVQSLQDTRVLRANAGCIVSFLLRLLSIFAGRALDGSRPAQASTPPGAANAPVTRPGPANEETKV